MKRLKERLISNLKIFIFISFIAIIIILIRTTSFKTIQALKNILPFYLFLSICATSLRYLFDIIRSIFLSKCMGKDISFKSATLFILGGQFLGGLTPFQIGGIPLQFYFLKRDKITIPETSSIIFARGMLSAIAFPIFLPFIFLRTDALESPIFKWLLYYLIFFYAFFLIVFILVSFGVRIKRLEGLKDSLERFRDIFFKEFKKRKKFLFLSFNCTILSLIFYIITAPLILKGLGVEIDFIKVSLLQVILTYSLNFLPTPGSSGFAEFGAYGIFKDVCPYEILGIYIILWRFITCYLGVIIGGILSSFYLLKKE